MFAACKRSLSLFSFIAFRADFSVTLNALQPQVRNGRLLTRISLYNKGNSIDKFTFPLYKFTRAIAY